jgi:L-amino acid N-acyltransferase YncA
MSLFLDDMRLEDWQQARLIYLEGIATGDATFETEAPEWQRWHETHLPFARLVVREGERLLGWAALSPVSSRTVYAGVAEVSVYLSAAQRGKGIGRLLLVRLIEEAEKNGIWTLQAGIFPENMASIALHQKCGFREVGRRQKLAKLNGRWRDVLLLERRSQNIGNP